MYEYRQLKESDFSAIVRTMKAGFADYFIKIKLDEAGCRNKFGIEGVEYESSVGAFENGQMVGLTMNAVGNWNGKRTVYDAGTVVIPDHRSKGVSTGMFDFILPKLAESGLERYVLEVIRENEPAIGLYSKLGFKKTRNLGVFAGKAIDLDPIVRPEIQFRKIDLDDVANAPFFEERGLAWQNSNELFHRAKAIGYDMEMTGLFIEDRMIGFGAVVPRTGRILRIAVDGSFRRKGFGTAIFSKLNETTRKMLVFVNLDLADEKAVAFLESLGCKKTVEQFEMVRDF